MIVWGRIISQGYVAMWMQAHQLHQINGDALDLPNAKSQIYKVSIHTH